MEGITMIRKVSNKAEKRMKNVVKGLREEFKSVRTGRARPSLVENIKAEYYGTLTPLNQMANISAPEARLIVIEPYDDNTIEDIEKAILKEDLGLTPNNDGNVIRINIPRLTKERREELMNTVSEKAEQAKVSIRNIRREANDELEDMENDSEISEDDYHRGLEDIQELTDEYEDKIFDIKANEIMTKHPITTCKNELAFNTLKLMEERKSQISVLPVVDKKTN